MAALAFGGLLSSSRNDNGAQRPATRAATPTISQPSVPGESPVVDAPAAIPRHALAVGLQTRRVTPPGTASPQDVPTQHVREEVASPATIATSDTATNVENAPDLPGSNAADLKDSDVTPPSSPSPRVDISARAQLEPRLILTSEESASLEAACSKANYLEGPAALQPMHLRPEGRLASAPRRPDFSTLSQPEQQSIEAACSRAKYLEGPAAFNRCLHGQFDQLAAAPARPALSRLTNPERESIEAACSRAKYLQGAAAYNQCLTNQLSSWAAAPSRPDLSALSGPERQSIEAACSQAVPPGTSRLQHMSDKATCISESS